MSCCPVCIGIKIDLAVLNAGYVAGLCDMIILASVAIHILYFSTVRYVYADSSYICVCCSAAESGHPNVDVNNMKM